MRKTSKYPLNGLIILNRKTRKYSPTETCVYIMCVCVWVCLNYWVQLTITGPTTYNHDNDYI